MLPIMYLCSEPTSIKAVNVQDVVWQLGAVPFMLKARNMLEKNCFVGFVGHQNAGKSTLVHALVGLDPQVSSGYDRL